MSDATQPKLLFMIGSPRSGTTWAQLLLAQHPDLATAQETHVFQHYLAPLQKRFEFDLARTDAQRKVGLPTILSQADLHALMRTFAGRVLERIHAARPGARVLLDKGEDRDAALIHDVLPEAWFLHVLRDPRAVACSIRGASTSFGKHWAPKSLVAAVEMWSAAVTSCRALSARTDRYREVRYEALTDDTPAELGAIHTWLGLATDREACARAAAACAFDELKKGGDGASRPWDTAKEPAGFFRKGRPDAWREELSRAELEVVEHVASPLMEELGYRRETPAGGVPRLLRGWERRRRAAARVRRVTEGLLHRFEGPKP